MSDEKKPDTFPDSLFGALFGGLAAGNASKEYIEALRRAQEYLEFESAKTINDWMN